MFGLSLREKALAVSKTLLRFVGFCKRLAENSTSTAENSARRVDFLLYLQKKRLLQASACRSRRGGLERPPVVLRIRYLTRYLRPLII